MPNRIDTDTLRRLVDEGRSQAEIARHFRVSESAVSQRLSKLKMLTSRVAALEKAGEVVDEKLSAVQRLEKVQDIIDRQLAWAVEQANQPGADQGSARGHGRLRSLRSPPETRPP